MCRQSLEKNSFGIIIALGAVELDLTCGRDCHLDRLF